VSEITAGLQPGDAVVTVGVDRLEEGGRVNAQVPGDNPAGGKRGSGKPGGGKPGDGRSHKAAS
jgi:hypothetical protein